MNNLKLDELQIAYDLHVQYSILVVHIGVCHFLSAEHRRIEHSILVESYIHKLS